MSDVDTDPYWVGRLSMAAAMAVPVIGKRPKEAQENLRRCLDEFFRSPLPDAGLKKSLREEMRT